MAIYSYKKIFFARAPFWHPSSLVDRDSVAQIHDTCSLWQVSSWGGYVFLINLIPLHVLALMITGRFSHRVYVAYSTVRFTGFESVCMSCHCLSVPYQFTSFHHLQQERR